MAKRKVGAEGSEGFGGIDVSASPTAIAPDKSQISSNTSVLRSGLLAARFGYARVAQAKAALPPRALIWFVGRDGVDKIMYEQTGSGLVYGAALPAPRWNDEPVVRPRTGGAGPMGASFNPVTGLTVTAATMKVDWTNPTSMYWRGTKVLRRTDTYPISPVDPDATTLLNSRAATVTDSAIATGTTAYYSVYAYSNTRWSKVAQKSATKV